MRTVHSGNYKLTQKSTVQRIFDVVSLHKVNLTRFTEKDHTHTHTLCTSKSR
jgi:hypothetical protein